MTGFTNARMTGERNDASSFFWAIDIPKQNSPRKKSGENEIQEFSTKLEARVSRTARTRKYLLCLVNLFRYGKAR